MPMFERYIGINYAGSGDPDEPITRLRVYVAEHGQPQLLFPDTSTRWSRATLAGFLKRELSGPTKTIVGLDHAFSFPQSYCRNHGITTWDEFLEHFSNTCPTRTTHVAKARHAIMRDGQPLIFRVTEKWISTAKSVLDFNSNGAALNTFAGLPWLWELRKATNDHVHFWPFDGWTPDSGKSVVCEVHAAMFRNRFPVPTTMPYYDRDAFVTALWLQERDQCDRLDCYYSPPLTECESQTAQLEGWILGLM